MTGFGRCGRERVKEELERNNVGDNIIRQNTLNHDVGYHDGVRLPSDTLIVSYFAFVYKVRDRIIREAEPYLI